MNTIHQKTFRFYIIHDEAYQKATDALLSMYHYHNSWLLADFTGSFQSGLGARETLKGIGV